jgi:hypothetical protein
VVAIKDGRAAIIHYHTVECAVWRAHLDTVLLPVVAVELKLTDLSADLAIPFLPESDLQMNCGDMPGR